MSAGSYGQFCPIAMTAEILCTRWTALILRELLCGSRRFNELRRGLPRISPTLLSKRLRELTAAGLVSDRGRAGGAVEYQLQPAGEALRPVILAMGEWGHRWLDVEASLERLDPSLLMWDIRRNIDAAAFAPERCTIQFCYPELAPGRRDWWLIVEAGEVELCGFDPGFPVRLTVTGSLRTMTAIWLGHAALHREIAAGRLEVLGEVGLERSMARWLGLSPFARPAADTGPERAGMRLK